VPLLAAHLLNGLPLSSVELDPAMLEQFDCVVILTDHRAFDYELIAAHARSLVDTRNALGHRSEPGIVRLGAPLPEPGPPRDDHDEEHRRLVA
jgi:UDP-N-acetyl-D-glucosamine dehydrogenase